MPNQDKFISDLEHRTRIPISPKNFTKKVRISLFIFLNVSFLLSILVFSSSFSQIEKLTLTSMIFLLTFGVFYFCAKKIRTIIVKGDTLILKSINHSNKVTSLRSIKNVKTRTFLGLQWTHLDYSLDGRAENIVFIGHSSSLPNTPEQTIKKAVNWSKKRKANLKPGPVSAN